MLALGAWRLARMQVLTRQPQAIEALGATTVLCVDKTGTLTCNRMAGRRRCHDGDAAHASSRETAALDGRCGRCCASRRSPACAKASSRWTRRSFACRRTAPAPGGAVRWREGVLPGRPFVMQGWRLDGAGAPAHRHQGRARGGARALRRLARAPASAAPRRPKLGRREGRRVIAVARPCTPATRQRRAMPAGRRARPRRLPRPSA